MDNTSSTSAPRSVQGSFKAPKVNTSLARMIVKVVDRHWPQTGVKSLSDIRDAAGKAVMTPLSMADRIDQHEAIKKWKASLSKADLHKIYRLVEKALNGNKKVQYERSEEALKSLKEASESRYANSADMRAASEYVGEAEELAKLLKKRFRDVRYNPRERSGTAEMGMMSIRFEESQNDAAVSVYITSKSRIKGLPDTVMKALTEIGKVLSKHNS